MKIIRENYLGLIGLLALTLAIPLHSGILQNITNYVGFIALIVYAWRGRNDFFFYFELVALFGASLNILGMPDRLKFSILLIISLLALLKVLSNKVYRVWYTAFGVLGLVGLVYGYATFNPIGYVIGSIGMVIYSFISYTKGIKIALVFAFLNIIYGSAAIYLVYSNNIHK